MATIGGGASEHTTGASEHISLDDAITKLKQHREADERATDILAAATILRDSTGRDRLESQRQMCGSTWGVSRRVKIGGKWKNRPINTVEKDLEAAVCNAAARWKPQSGAEDSAGASEYIDAGGVSLEDTIEKLRSH